VDLRGGSSAAELENVQHVVKAKTACLTQGVKVGTIRIDVATCSANDLGKGDNLFRYGCNAVVGDGFCYFTYQFQDLRYNLESTKQSWQDSEDACVQLGHSCHLSSIHDAAEQQLILDLGVTEDTWIGLNGTMVGGTKTWVFSDGTPFTYTDGWANNKPNSGLLTECACLKFDQPNFKWDDDPRSSKKQSVCKCTKRFAATTPHFGRPADFDKYTLEYYTTTEKRWRARAFDGSGTLLVDRDLVSIEEIGFDIDDVVVPSCATKTYDYAGPQGEEQMVVIGARVETKHDPMHVVSAECSVTWLPEHRPAHACDPNQLENARQLLPTTNGDGGSKIYDFVYDFGTVRQDVRAIEIVGRSTGLAQSDNQFMLYASSSDTPPAPPLHPSPFQYNFPTSDSTYVATTPVGYKGGVLPEKMTVGISIGVITS
jgi:hypothetical protein